MFGNLDLEEGGGCCCGLEVEGSRSFQSKGWSIRNALTLRIDQSVIHHEGVLACAKVVDGGAIVASVTEDMDMGWMGRERVMQSWLVMVPRGVVVVSATNGSGGREEEEGKRGIL